MDDKSIDIDAIVVEINKSIASTYFGHMDIYKSPSRKEIIEEARNDLETLLKKTQTQADTLSFRRAYKFKEILDLLFEIPSEDLFREDEFTHELFLYANRYSLSFSDLKEKDMIPILSNKYALIGAKARLQDKVNFGGGNSSTQNMVAVADKYLELLRIE
ncbi:MAG: hypothetical protein V1743_00520 [Nanoarchaeota archaeon]